MDNRQPQHRPTAYDILQVRTDAHALVIAAAYRALARLHHPDADPRPDANQRMAELNDAYTLLRSADARAAYDRAMEQAAAVVAASEQVAAVAPAAQAQGPQRPSNEGSGISAPLDFGRYVGWTIEQIAGHDPDYLRWLRRHSSGIRYRRAIDERLQNVSASAGRKPSPWHIRARGPLAA